MTCSHEERRHICDEKRMPKESGIVIKGALALVTIKKRLKVKSFAKPRSYWNKG